MAYDAIDEAEIAIKQPITHALWTKVKDNFDAIYGQIAPGSGMLGVPNFSMEIDADSDGVPDGWSKSLYPGGAGAFDTTTPYHGAKAYKFTHPGGGGNGGGKLTSDYFEISEYISPLVQWAAKASAALKCQVNLLYYTAAKAYVSSDTLWSTTSAAATWTGYRAVGIPPATARYCKVELVGGYTDTDVAGDAYFDAVLVDPFPYVIPISFSTTEVTSTNVAYTDVYNTTVNIPKGFSALHFSASLMAGTGATVADMRWRIGTTYSNEQSMWVAATYLDFDFEISVAALSGAETIYLQLKADGTNTVYGKKDTGYAYYYR